MNLTHLLQARSGAPESPFITTKPGRCRVGRVLFKSASISSGLLSDWRHNPSRIEKGGRVAATTIGVADDERDSRSPGKISPQANGCRWRIHRDGIRTGRLWDKNKRRQRRRKVDTDENFKVKSLRRIKRLPECPGERIKPDGERIAFTPRTWYDEENLSIRRVNGER